MLNLRRERPFILSMSGEGPNVEPSCFNYHFGVVDKFIEHFIFYFAVKLILEMFDEEKHEFS